MSFPVSIHLGESQLHLHFVCEVLAYTLGFRLYVYLRRHTEDLISEENRLWIFLGAAVGGFLGGHLLGILENPSLLSTLNLIYFMGNKTIVGGFLGGLVGVEFTKKIVGVHTSSGDLMVYPLILGTAIGRVGCFLEGLQDGTYGTESALPWAIDFGDGIRRHPTQLYEIAFVLLLGAGIFWLEKRYVLSNGSRFKLFLVSYLLFRFWIEYLKPAVFLYGVVSVIQLACLMGLLYYWRVFVMPQHLILSSHAQRHKTV